MSSRVLLADDSAAMQKIVAIALEPFDVNLQSAASYADVYRRIENFRPEVLVISGMLPGIANMSQMQVLAESLGGIPIVIVIGSYDEINEDDLREQGFANFLKKPFDSATLVQVLREKCGLRLPLKAQADQMSPLPPPPPPTFAPIRESVSETSLPVFEISPPPPPSFAAPPPFGLSHELKGKKAFDGEPFSSKQDVVPSVNLDIDFNGEPSYPPPPSAGNLGPTVAKQGADHPQNWDFGARSEPAASHPPSFSIPARPPIPPPVPRPSTDRAGQGVESDAGHGSAAFKGINFTASNLEPYLATLVREVVLEFCQKHLKAITREVVQEELRRLANERTRHLVDK